MKKLIFNLCVCTLLVISVQGRSLSKKEAQKIMETALEYLKSADSNAFANLWQLDDKPWPHHKNAFTKKDVMDYFVQVREFLDVVLKEHLTIAGLQVKKSDEDPGVRLGEYNVRAYFKISNRYFKGFGFFLDYKDDKWVVRYAPETFVSQEY